MNSQLLEILVCPESKNKLFLAPGDVIENLNKLIQQNKCLKINGEPVTEKIDEALIEPVTRVVYIIKESIPVLIYEYGIQL